MDAMAEVEQTESGTGPTDGAGEAARTRGARRQAPAWMLAGLLLLYALFLLRNFAPALYTPDANGYYAQGSLLVATGRTWFTLDSPVQYVGIHWLRDPQGRYFSRYPPGLAVAVALLCRLGSPELSTLLNPALALLGVVGIFLLARRFFSPWWALAAAFLLLSNPVYNLHAIVCDSHMAVTVLLIWGLYFLIRWADERRLHQAFAAGLLLGCIPAVRYPEALFALGIAAFLLSHGRSLTRPWLHVLAAAAGAALPLLPILARNQSAFGAFWKTAYAFTNEQSGFSARYFAAHFAQYLRYLQSDGVGVFFALGIVGLAVLCAQPRTRRAGWLFVLLVLPTTLLYMAYYWSSPQMPQGTMRFLLPTFPVYVLAGVAALHDGAERWTLGLRRAVVLALLLIQTLWGAAGAAELRLVHDQKDALARVTRALKDTAPPGSVVLAHPQIEQHLDFIRRWKLVDMGLARERPTREGVNDQDDDGAPRPMQAGKLKAQTERYAGMRPGERETAFADDVRAWAGKSRIFYVGTQEEIDRLPGAWFNPDNFTVVRRVPLPNQPAVSRGTPREPQRDDSLAVAPRRGGMGRQPGRGGMGNWLDFLHGSREVVIAEWTPRWRLPRRAPDPLPL